MVGYPSRPPLFLSVAMRAFFLVPGVSLGGLPFIFSTGCRFLPPSHMGSYPGSGLAPNGSNTPIVSFQIRIQLTDTL
jgi:hypothetical protein